MKKESLYAAAISAVAFISGIGLTLHWLSQGQQGSARFEIFGNNFEVMLSEPNLREIVQDPDNVSILRSLVQTELHMYEVGPALVQRLERIEPSEPVGRQLRAMRDGHKGPFREHPVSVTAQVTDERAAERGVATVCLNSTLTNRYALIRDPNSERLVQVFAQRVMPCQADEERITLSSLDARDLAWDETDAKRAVSVLIAPPGYRFNIF